MSSWRSASWRRTPRRTGQTRPEPAVRSAVASSSSSLRAGATGGRYCCMGRSARWSGSSAGKADAVGTAISLSGPRPSAGLPVRTGSRSTVRRGGCAPFWSAGGVRPAPASGTVAVVPERGGRGLA